MITEVTVSSGRTLPHPRINFATLRADITVRFTMSEDDEPDERIVVMQDYADKLSRQHMKRLIQEAKYEDS